MEIESTYLKALIEECGDPVAVVQASKLSGERDSQQAARHTLLRHFDQPSLYNPIDHVQQVCAMRKLGIDLPPDENVRIVKSTSPIRPGRC